MTPSGRYGSPYALSRARCTCVGTFMTWTSKKSRLYVGANSLAPTTYEHLDLSESTLRSKRADEGTIPGRLGCIHHRWGFLELRAQDWSGQRRGRQGPPSSSCH
jgi:hypothetical protein